MRQLLVFLLLVAAAAAMDAQDVQYGGVDELCGTKRLFVDSGLYLEGRNNIVSIVEAAQLDGFQTVSNLAEADVLIKLTSRGARNWAQWSVFIFASDDTPRLIHQLADTDENDGLRRFWPSSKIARKFVELHRAANVTGKCSARLDSVTSPVRTQRSDPGRGVAAHVTPIIEQLQQADLRSLVVDEAAFKELDGIRSSILGRAELLKHMVPVDPLGTLERLGELYELRRELDFFWFGLEMLARADDDAKNDFLNGLRRQNTALGEITASAQKAVAERLVETLVKCGQR